MPRYWMTLCSEVQGSLEECIRWSGGDKKKGKAEYKKQINYWEEMAKLAGYSIGSYSGSTDIVLKTYDLDEAKEMRDKCIELAKKILDPVDDKVALDGIDEMLITSQPECPKCEELGKFSYTHCPKCGTELTPSETFHKET